MFPVGTAYFRAFAQRLLQTSEKHETCFNVFHSECSLFSRFCAKVVKITEKICVCSHLLYVTMAM